METGAAAGPPAVHRSCPVGGRDLPAQYDVIALANLGFHAHPEAFGLHAAFELHRRHRRGMSLCFRYIRRRDGRVIVNRMRPGVQK